MIKVLPFFVALGVCITVGFGAESNSSKEDVKKALLFQGKESYELYLKKGIQDKPLKTDGKKVNVVTNESGAIDTFKTCEVITKEYKEQK